MLIWEIPFIALVVLLVLDILRQIVALGVLKSIVSEFSLKTYCYGVVIPLITVTILSLIFPVFAHKFIEEGFFRFFVVLIISFLSVVVSIYVVGLDKNEKSLVKQLLTNVRTKFIKR